MGATPSALPAAPAVIPGIIAEVRLWQQLGDGGGGDPSSLPSP
jgi:hypothetical protein